MAQLGVLVVFIGLHAFWIGFTLVKGHKMNMKTALFGAVGLAMCINGAALSDPTIWESDFGIELSDLTGEDDEAEMVTLSFDFAFAGINYTELYVGTNGGVALGDLGEADDYPSGDEFFDTTAPMISTFWSDMDLGSNGGVYFNDFGDRAVFTWDGIGSYEDDSTSNSFQLQLFDNGKIIFGYNGIEDNNSDNFDADIHIGLTEGNDPSVDEVDYSDGGPFSTGASVLELFGYDDSDFDLDQSNIIFMPNIGAPGYTVTVPTPGAVSLLALGGLVATRRRR